VRVLVTGVDGFVGGHLAPYLIEQGHEVYGTVLHDAESKANLPEGLTTIRVDLNDYDTVAEAFEISKPDWVFHLAAVSNLPESFIHVMDAWRTNLIGTLHLYEAARKTNIRMRILFVSSAAVYGPVSGDEVPLAESAPFRPAEPYGASKAAGELASMQYRQSFGLRIIRARSFNHTGPGQPPRFVTSEFARTIALAEAGKIPPVITVGNLRARRDLTDVRDIVRAYVLLLEKGVAGEVYNVCSGRDQAITDVLGRLVALSNVELEVRVAYEKIRPVELPVLIGDPTKIREEIGWEPQIPWEQTMRDCLDWWREKIASNGAEGDASGPRRAEYP